MPVKPKKIQLKKKEDPSAGSELGKTKAAAAKPKAVKKKKEEPAVAPAVAVGQSAAAVGAKDDGYHQRIRIKIMAYDHKIIDQSTKTIIETAQRSGAKIIGPIPLPTKIDRFTVNRSTFVHKDSREQYEMRIHKRLLDIMDPTPKTVDSLQNLSLPAGVDVEIKM